MNLMNNISWLIVNTNERKLIGRKNRPCRASIKWAMMEFYLLSLEFNGY